MSFSDDEHDDGGTKDIEDNVLGDTFDEEHSKEVEWRKVSQKVEGLPRC